MCVDGDDRTTDRESHCFRKAQMCDGVSKCKNNYDERTSTCYMIHEPSSDYEKVCALLKATDRHRLNKINAVSVLN
jgi:hypothetical protein